MRKEENNKNNKNKTLVVLFLLCLTLIGLYMYFFKNIKNEKVENDFKNKKENNNLNNFLNIESDNFEIEKYTDKNKRFDVKYPKSWFVDFEDAIAKGSHLILSPKKDSRNFISFTITPVGKIEVDGELNDKKLKEMQENAIKLFENKKGYKFISKDFMKYMNETVLDIKLSYMDEIINKEVIIHQIVRVDERNLSFIHIEIVKSEYQNLKEKMKFIANSYNVLK